MKISCCIFDCDGLMFNTEYYARKNWETVLRHHHIPVPEGFMDAITGAGKDQFNSVMNAHPEIWAVYDEVRAGRQPEIDLALQEHGNINKPGLVELLMWLHCHPYKVCVASSSPTEYVQLMLKTIGYDYPFDVVLGGDAVRTAKPDPALFLKAAALAGCIPEECLVLEDSKNGHLAALAAGMHRVFIEDLVKPDQEMKDHLIEFVCHDLSEVIPLLEGMK